uniref:Uncharacterized LOC107082927 n=1 Tax=Cyprinodon variegatus TaxID=28743 RepID=A0A3Q2DFB0_CYPVA
MRIYKTVLYSQEVMHVVLVHSPASQREFSQFPSLSLDPNAVCVFSDGCFIWRPEAMCETHGYELVYRHQTRQMETWTCPPQFYVWDHVAVALHVGPKVLKFNVDQLRTKLKFCQQDEVSYGQNFGNPDGFDGAKAEVNKLWPGWTGLLEIERSLKHSLTVTDIQLVLVGWPGVGKSSSGNTILGRTAFNTSSAAASQLSGGTQCCLQRGTIFSREVTIIDTPGISGRFSPDLKKEILRCINLWSPVPHAILLVARLGFFPTNVKKTVKQMETMFGENVWSRTVILLTHQDQAEPDVKTQLQECKAKLKEPFLKKVCLVLNISPECKDLQQIWDLLHEATKLVSEQMSVSRMQ